MLRVVADVGGTNVRVAVLDERGYPGPPVRLRVADFPGLPEALRAALKGLGVESAPVGALAVCAAGPPRGGRIEMTNAPWVVDGKALARAFDPFFAQRTDGTGTGLGLFLVRAQLRRMGGTIRLSRSATGGTVAELSWPIGPSAPG